MYLLYLDESGTNESGYFVLAGLAIFERQTYWLSEEFNKLEHEFLPDAEDPVHFHASAIRAARDEPWASMPRAHRYELLDRAYEAIRESRATLFAVAVERRWLARLDDDYSEYTYAFESLTKSFDDFLRRLYRDESNRQKGLIVIAESQYQERIEAVAQRVREDGTKWGDLYNIVEIPFFTQAANSRLLQVADFCANAVYGRYEGGYTRQFDKIVPRFDQNEGVYCGLWHYCGDHWECSCPACLSRRMSGGPPPTDSPNAAL
jgi:hypothetical protein